MGDLSASGHFTTTTVLLCHFTTTLVVELRHFMSLIGRLCGFTTPDWSVASFYNPCRLRHWETSKLYHILQIESMKLIV